MLGSIGLSPAADVTGLVDKAVAGTLAWIEARLQGILFSLARLHPDLNLDDYRHGAATTYWDVLSSCAGPRVHERGIAITKLEDHDFTPSTQAADRLRDLLSRWALPQRKLSA